MEKVSQVTLLVNGKQAEDTLEQLRVKAEQLGAAMSEAQKRGDKVRFEKLGKELTVVTKQIEGLEESAKGVDQAMSMMMQEKNKKGLTVVFDKMGKAIRKVMPDWFNKKFPDFQTYYRGMTNEEMGRLYGQLQVISDHYQDGSGQVSIALPNGKNLTIESLDQIKGLMERLLNQIAEGKHLEAQWQDSQGGKGSKNRSYRYVTEDAWKEQQDTENWVAYASKLKDYATYLKDRTKIEISYLKLKIANSKSTDKEIAAMQKQVSKLERSEQIQEQKIVSKEEEQHLLEQRKVVMETHEQTLATLSELNQSGQLSYKAYKEAVLREDIEYLQTVKQYYASGSQYRYYIEREINSKIKQQREQQAKSLQETETALQKKYFAGKEVRTREDIDKEHLLRQQALTLLYQNMIASAGDNQKQLAAVTKMYQKAQRKEAIAYARATGQDISLTLQEKLEGLYEWWNGEQGKKWKTAISDIGESMSSIFSSVTEMAQIECEIQTSLIQKRYDTQISMAEGNAYKVNRLEKRRDKELAAEKKKQSDKTFGLQVLQAIASTAANAVKAYGDGLEIGGMAGLIMAPIAAAAATAAGLVQIALISKQRQQASSTYQQGGFTRQGKADEVAGVVHAGEWVASKRLVDSPQARPLINALEQAQRTNTIGSLGVLTGQRVNETTGQRVSETTGQRVNEATSVVAGIDSALNVSRMIGDVHVTLEKLVKRLDTPMPAVVSVTGDNGVERAQKEYQKLMNNKSPKSRRKIS